MAEPIGSIAGRDREPTRESYPAYRGVVPAAAGVEAVAQLDQLRGVRVPGDGGEEARGGRAPRSDRCSGVGGVCGHRSAKGLGPRPPGKSGRGPVMVQAAESPCASPPTAAGSVGDDSALA